MSILSVNIKNIIFDFGGVIINLNFHLTLKAFQKLGIKIDRLEEIMQKPFFDEFESGKISPEVFRNNLRTYIPDPVSDRDLDNAWNKLLLDIPKERIKLLEELKTKYRIFLLSNSNKIHYNYYRNNLEKEYAYKDFSEIFEKAYFSFDVGTTKPSAEIYLHALNNSKLEASDTIFIDDLLPNVEAAQNIGMNGYWLKETESILDIF